MERISYFFLCLGTRIYRVVDYTNSYNGYDADYTIPKGAQCFYSQSDEVGDYEVRDVTHWMPLPEPPKDK